MNGIFGDTESFSIGSFLGEYILTSQQQAAELVDTGLHPSCLGSTMGHPDCLHTLKTGVEEKHIKLSNES